MFKGKILSMNF